MQGHDDWYLAVGMRLKHINPRLLCGTAIPQGAKGAHRRIMFAASPHQPFPFTAGHAYL